jgi:hypothetical protein
MSTLWKDIQYKMLKSGNKISLLIGINVIVYLVLNALPLWNSYLPVLVTVILAYTNEYLLLPASLPKLLYRFWTPLPTCLCMPGFSYPV